MTYAIEPEVMNLYRYDLDRFLKDRMNRHADIAWIVKLLNNLPNDLSFDTAGDFLIPTDSLIQKLFHSYTSIKANPV